MFVISVRKFDEYIKTYGLLGEKITNIVEATRFPTYEQAEFVIKSFGLYKTHSNVKIIQVWDGNEERDVA